MATKATRQAFGETIVRLAEKNPQIVVMDADLSKSTMTGAFHKKFPERYFEMGIAEHNLIGTAAGLALCGKTPFAASFACFLAGRYEAIRMSVAYCASNVKLVGTHSGIGIGEDGYSQMGLEDIGVLRSLPNMTLLQPADDWETQQAVEWAAHYKGPVYLRLTRQKVQDVHSENYKFNVGKGDLLKDSTSGKDQIAIFATGGVVYNALKAGTELEQEGVGNCVINFHTLHPIDAEIIVNTAKRFPKMIAIEDHSHIGGLGSAVSEVLAAHGLSNMLLRHGVKDFAHSGSPEALYEEYGFSASGIKKKISDFMKI